MRSVVELLFAGRQARRNIGTPFDSLGSVPYGLVPVYQQAMVGKPWEAIALNVVERQVHQGPSYFRTRWACIRACAAEGSGGRQDC
jgi:hypothetical protein